MLPYTAVAMLRVMRGRGGPEPNHRGVGPGPFRSADGAGPTPNHDRRRRTGSPVAGPVPAETLTRSARF
jgi:hypothetical protein